MLQPSVFFIRKFYLKKENVHSEDNLPFFFLLELNFGIYIHVYAKEVFTDKRKRKQLILQE